MKLSKILRNWVYVLLSALGLFMFISLFEQTFPIASVDLKINRTEACSRAVEYLSTLGYDVSDYESSVVFSGDRKKFVFLEKSLGLEKANTLTRKDIPIWYWHVRFFKELEKEGFEVRVNPIGRVDGFSHLLEESAPGEHATIERANDIVMAYFRLNNVPVENFELIESSSTKRENRTDHHFIWKMKNSDVMWREGEKEGKGMMRIALTVHGLQIGGFRLFFGRRKYLNDIFVSYSRKEDFWQS